MDNSELVRGGQGHSASDVTWCAAATLICTLGALAIFIGAMLKMVFYP